MKKSKLIALVLVCTMIFMGVGYASWNDSVKIETNVSTGKLDVRFVDRDKYDEGRCGKFFNNFAELDSYISTSDPIGKINPAGDILTVNVGNFYPTNSSREGWLTGEDLELPAVSIFSSMKNKGTIPVKFKSVQIDFEGEESSKKLFDSIRVENGTVFKINYNHLKGIFYKPSTGKYYRYDSISKPDWEEEGYDHYIYRNEDDTDMNLEEFRVYLNNRLKGFVLYPEEMLTFASIEGSPYSPDEINNGTRVSPWLRFYLSNDGGNETQNQTCKINIKFNWVLYTQ